MPGTDADRYRTLAQLRLLVLNAAALGPTIVWISSFPGGFAANDPRPILNQGVSAVNVFGSCEVLNHVSMKRARSLSPYSGQSPIEQTAGA